jgi:uncharacterized pyridoxamine 5'-phosphate oxidase family protein
VDHAELVAFVQRHPTASIATVGSDGRPRSAMVEVAITEAAEIIFDTSVRDRDYQNILVSPQVAFVIGGDESVTVQSEGVADVLTGADLDRCLRVFFQQCPAGRGRARDPDIVHIRIRPRWVRLDDHRPESYGTQEIPLDPPSASL